MPTIKKNPSLFGLYSRNNARADSMWTQLCRHAIEQQDLVQIAQLCFTMAAHARRPCWWRQRMMSQRFCSICQPLPTISCSSRWCFILEHTRGIFALYASVLRKYARAIRRYYLLMHVVHRFFMSPNWILLLCNIKNLPWNMRLGQWKVYICMHVDERQKHRKCEFSSSN